MNQDKRNAMIEEYGHGFDLLTSAIAEIPHKAWTFNPASGEWSVREILVHMADSETMGMIILHKLIAEPGGNLMTYEEDKWAEVLNYRDQDEGDALQIFKLIRRTTYRLLKTLPDQVFLQSVPHPLYDEPYTLEKWLIIYTQHVSEHVEQLKKTRQMWEEHNH